MSPRGRHRPEPRITRREIVQLVVFGLFMAGLFVLAAACQRQDAREWETRNLDPRAGVVRLERDGADSKECDGTTLLYRAYGHKSVAVSAVPDSPECAP